MSRRSCTAREAALGRIRSRLGDVATVVGLGAKVTMADVVADLAERGVKRLMVEGGGRLHTQFLVDDLADELQLVVAPFFVGESRAPRFVEAGPFPWTASRRATWPRPAGSATWSCCGTPCRIDSRPMRGSPSRSGSSPHDLEGWR